MKIQTTRFSEIDVDEEKLLHFPQGIPPFDDCKTFALINTEETSPFLWLQATTMPEVALAVINPFRILPDYSPTVSEQMLESIGNPPDEDILVLTVAVIPSDFESMTTNLVSPILINAQSNQGRQVIMENSPYQIRQPIYHEVQALLMGGAEDAHPDAQD